MVREINNLSDMLPILTYFQKNSDYNGIGVHFHRYHQLVLVREGLANFRINGVDYPAGKDSLIIIRAFDTHNVSIRKYPYKRYVFTVTNQLALTALREPKLLSLFLYHRADARNLVLLREEFARRLSAVFEETIRECEEKKPMWSSRVIMLIIQILIELYREDPSLFSAGDYVNIIDTVSEIQNYVAQHFREHIVLDDMASKYFVSKYYLSRKFKEITGFGFKNFLIRYRINEAQHLLQYTNKSVAEISSVVGYENPEHFIRIFHETQGISPLQYRKTAAPVPQ
ncbi:MAG: AraC family transcriptional regulator [Treponema sp.]|jgi:AraC-like DNA-binding protein|nr:AraC family transcriptional regulator [Treponema sp.]